MHDLLITEATKFAKGFIRSVISCRIIPGRVEDSSDSGTWRWLATDMGLDEVYLVHLSNNVYGPEQFVPSDHLDIFWRHFEIVCKREYARLKPDNA